MFAAFSFGRRGAKEKANKKKHAVLRGVAPAPHNLLTQVDENCYLGAPRPTPAQLFREKVDKKRCSMRCLRQIYLFKSFLEVGVREGAESFFLKKRFRPLAYNTFPISLPQYHAHLYAMLARDDLTGGVLTLLFKCVYALLYVRYELTRLFLN